MDLFVVTKCFNCAGSVAGGPVACRQQARVFQAEVEKHNLAVGRPDGHTAVEASQNAVLGAHVERRQRGDRVGQRDGAQDTRGAHVKEAAKTLAASLENLQNGATCQRGQNQGQGTCKAYFNSKRLGSIPTSSAWGESDARTYGKEKNGSWVVHFNAMHDARVEAAVRHRKCLGSQALSRACGGDFEV